MEQQGKKRFTIVLIILLIIIGVVVGLWLLARHKQEQAGVAPSSFREFLGLGGEKTVSPAPNGSGTEGGGSFTGPDTGTTGGTTTTNPEPTTTSSTFTNTPYVPVSDFPGGGEFTPPLLTDNGGTTPTTTTPPTSTTPPTTTQPSLQCSSADTNILFTADELAKLKALQDRFYLIAQNLHTDADANTELANHDVFKAKVDKFTELYNYCQNHPIAGRRIPTPFWQNTAQNNTSFLLSAISPTNPRITLGTTSNGTTSTSTTDPNTGQTTTTTTNNPSTVDTTTSITFPADNTRGQFDINDPYFGMRALEYILKLDVW